MTLQEFSKSILGPMVLSSIRSGRLDGVLCEMLAEHAEEPFLDDETAKAMLDRAKHLVLQAHLK